MSDDKRDERIEKALSTLAELCDVKNPSDEQYGRRGAAEEILRHYREEDMREKGINVNLRIEGHVPVRPIVQPPYSPHSSGPGHMPPYGTTGG